MLRQSRGAVERLPDAVLRYVRVLQQGSGVSQ